MIIWSAVIGGKILNLAQIRDCTCILYQKNQAWNIKNQLKLPTSSIAMVMLGCLNPKIALQRMKILNVALIRGYTGILHQTSSFSWSLPTSCIALQRINSNRTNEAKPNQPTQFFYRREKLASNSRSTSFETNWIYFISFETDVDSKRQSVKIYAGTELIDHELSTNHSTYNGNCFSHSALVM